MRWFCSGGPNLIELPDGRIVAGGRFTDGRTRTALAFLDPSSGALTELLTLPSGGDSSYPGLLWRDDRLWVSYYSAHEGKASIYLATVTFAHLPEPAAVAAPMAGGGLLLLSRRHRALR